MKTFSVAFLAAIELFSSNTHDKSMEAAMTGAFVGGPLIAVLSMIAILTL